MALANDSTNVVTRPTASADHYVARLGQDLNSLELHNISSRRDSEGGDDPSGSTASASTTGLSQTQTHNAAIQYFALCFVFYVAGWNDGTTGPLLPRIQAVYNLDFTLVSLIFVFNCVGFISAAAANVALTDRFGFGRVMVLGAVTQLAGYALEAAAPPFPVFVLGYFLNGFGLALQEAGANGYVSSIAKNPSLKIAFMHAIYGLGAFSSPFVSTQFSEQRHWSFHYLTSLGLAVVNAVLLCGVLRFRTQDQCLTEIGQVPPVHAGLDEGKYKQMSKLRPLHLLALFIFIYDGIEVTMGGWIVTYVIDVRAGGPSSGYISSGFFGGLMFGRLAFLWLNKIIGERNVLFLYIVLAIGLELVVWFLPSIVGAAVAVAFVGLVLGPIYPLVMNYSRRVLPPWLLTGCIGWIAGFGQAGSAALPFAAGLLANKEGIKSLQPFLVSSMACLVCLWALVPNHPRRLE